MKKTIDYIYSIVAKYDLKNKSRKPEIVLFNRHYFAYFCDIKLKMSHKDIALLVDQQRTTPYHSVETAKNLIRLNNKKWNEITKDIREDLSKCPINKVVLDDMDIAEKEILRINRMYFGSDFKVMKKFIKNIVESKN